MKKDCSNCERVRYSIPCYECLIGNNDLPSRWLEGENYVPETIALRAVQQVNRRMQKADVPLPALLRRIGVSRQLFSRWKKNKGDISAYYLKNMALDGYDTHYILTGNRKV